MFLNGKNQYDIVNTYKLENKYIPILKKLNGNSILLLYLSRLAWREVFSSVSYRFSQFLTARTLCREKVVEVWGRRLRICKLFSTKLLLERTGSGTTSNQLSRCTTLLHLVWTTLPTLGKLILNMWGKKLV